MYEYYLLLKGTNKDLATTEFETLWNVYFNEKINLTQVQNTLYSFNSNNQIKKDHILLKRLTFTNYLGVKLWSGKSYENYFQTLSNLNFSYLENETFAIIQKTFSKGELISSKELAKPIWDSLENPKVDLKNAKYNFQAFTVDKNIIFTKELLLNQKDYLDRMPKLRPIAKPYTLKSDMARAACNLTNIKEGVLLDPFAGIGGILLEASDLGFEVWGNDISYNDLQDLRKNFKHYHPNITPKLTLCDSKKQFLKDNCVDAIVTDIPYGKSCRRLGVDLYDGFLKSAKSYLKPGCRLIVIYANFLEFKELALKYFKEVKEIDQYINKSMTRHILILENDK